MGGRGSGSGQRGKETTLGLSALDVRRLQRDGLLTLGNTFTCNWVREGQTVASIQVLVEASRVAMAYHCSSGDGNGHQMEYSAYLDWTDCHLGGRRVWFRCPANGCGRRVALLYLGCSGIFACRHCYMLAYASQRKSVGNRAKARADRIRSKLGWEGSIMHGNGDKPKGMWSRTFDRLVENHHNFAMVAVSEAIQKFTRSVVAMKP